MCSKTLECVLATLLLCCLIVPQHALQFPSVVKKQVRKVHIHCVNQTGITEEALVAARNKMPDDSTFKCFLHCMFEMFGLIDSEQVMHLESLNEVLPEELHPKIINLFETCGTKKGINACDTAFQTVLCYLNVDGPFIKSAIDDLVT